uniref:RAP domain-containing protein n=1 Tax=Babesia bovis TaxID=5865 RepID=A7AQU7_BABBO|eukprot:XP_001610484.1 hypothetical protein [Babesia bovis T2Bo]
MDKTSANGTQIRRFCIVSDYYNRIVERATCSATNISYDDAARYLSQFVDNRFDASKLRPFLGDIHAKLSVPLTIDDYLIVLETCSILKFQDLDLVSSICEDLRLAFLTLYEPKKAVRHVKPSNGDLNVSTDTTSSFSNRRFQLDTSVAPVFKDAVLGTFDIFNRSNVNTLGVSTAVSIYSSLSILDLLDEELALSLESRFGNRRKSGERLEFEVDDTLNIRDIIEIGYSKLIQQDPGNDSFWLMKDLLERKLTVLIAQLKCSAEPCYNSIRKDHIETLESIIGSDIGYKKFKTTTFINKVAQHLEKLRIRFETNVYYNGILLDIMEKDRNLVWLCNSYHRFYAGTFDLTAERRTLDRLLKAFGFKTCHVNFYQWGRLKAKRTRFAYIRMARYYALYDNREYDHRYAGWSLPYVWWNTSRQDQMHVSNYIKYEP